MSAASPAHGARVVSARAARTVADAVLYEGYLLYPYRASSAKNQVRWQFGVLGPAGAAAAGVGEESSMHTETLVRGAAAGAGAEMTVYLRFLQLQTRTAEQADGAGGFTPVAQFSDGAREWVSWDEAVAHELEFGPFALADLRAGRTVDVTVPGGVDTEGVPWPSGGVAGRLVRRRADLAAQLTLEAADVDGLIRLAMTITNTAGQTEDRDAACQCSFLGAHLLLDIVGGDFVSLLEPPDDATAAAAGCANRRCWPVLVAEPGQRDMLLVSPIILYDYPAVAPESAGELYDSTEIDEILTLRVMTLTEQEKAEARATDPRAAAIIDRCDTLSAGELARLHGVLRDPSATSGPRGNARVEPEFPTFTEPGLDTGKAWWDPEVDATFEPSRDSVRIGAVDVSKGSRVRVHPSRRADAQDLFFAEQVARVAGVYFDADGEVHVAVVLEDDPAADLHDWYGRYLYFAPDELEPLAAGAFGEHGSHAVSTARREM